MVDASVDSGGGCFPKDLFGCGKRHLVVFAHQDDELPNAGTLMRVGADADIVWITNGDGLYEEAKRDPEVYAAQRTAESHEAARILGVPESQRHFMGYSEIAIYSRIRALASATGAYRSEVLGYFEEMAQKVLQIARAVQPDVIWTQAWQGGHPEHDIAHLCAVFAARALASESNGSKTPALLEFPAYELGVLVPLRFAPWRMAPVYWVNLTAREQVNKKSMMRTYPTQDEIIAVFERVIGFYGRLAGLVGRRFSLDDFSAREVFGPAPADRNYQVPPHGNWRLEYLFDRLGGKVVDFNRTISPIATALLG